MKSEVLSNFTFTLLPTMALVLFFVMFTGVVIWVYRKSSGKVYGEASNLPLNEGDKDE